MRVRVWESVTGELTGGSGLPCRDEGDRENELDVLMKRSGKCAWKAWILYECVNGGWGKEGMSRERTILYSDGLGRDEEEEGCRSVRGRIWS